MRLTPCFSYLYTWIIEVFLYLWAVKFSINVTTILFDCFPVHPCANIPRILQTYHIHGERSPSIWTLFSLCLLFNDIIPWVRSGFLIFLALNLSLEELSCLGSTSVWWTCSSHWFIFLLQPFSITSRGKCGKHSKPSGLQTTSFIVWPLYLPLSPRFFSPLNKQLLFSEVGIWGYRAMPLGQLRLMLVSIFLILWM